MALRNNGIDRRYLSKRDREDWNNSGGPRQKQALAKVKRWEGRIKWEENRPKRTTLPKSLGKSHTGGFEMGIGAQQMRLQDKSAQLERSKELRPEKYSVPDIYND